ncbi:glucosamine--fructose-6-phosphate aminotransferase (isomerizing) [Andreprevotia lacus DSM 23236]|jgi:glucosamine--fructose-6-phosphate aminotransferase (isomerizing)|uniref:Glutamine--fructose-6-phosphate aminotransferase [isomerizing] n=1 Tax=Andreprevotia lacus DSM 23236 TaxID=1121001 RepID=A0A1W1XPX1_9NEIS|nr:glutamine--fructose-6-phosphate transaminase (isomerizing) [Andreprevotia lacus]SMC25917.1 glucosamine--fructose-6-phosphate aminotransferase (isomerizing) [Andreprevotia lacus DSM 23236]
MSYLIGLIAAQNCLPALEQQTTRLSPLQMQGCVAISGDQTRISMRADDASIGSLSSHLGYQEPNRLLMRLDWGDAASHACMIERDLIGVVMRGNIENGEDIASKLESLGYSVPADNSIGLIAALIHWHHRTQRDLARATLAAMNEINGLYAIGVIERENANELVFASAGIPLLIASHQGGYACADQLSPLLPFATDVIRLNSGDVATISPLHCEVIDAGGAPVRRAHDAVNVRSARADLDRFSHYMGKEISEQPAMLADALARLGTRPDLRALVGDDGTRRLSAVDAIVLIASGSSYHAALTARYWLEGLAGIPTTVELASEFRYMDAVLQQNTLAIGLSQSGETADTLAALRHAQQLGASVTMGVSNARNSSLMRLAQLQLIHEVGPEIAVTSTKTFSAQLLLLYLLSLGLAQQRGHMTPALQQQAHSNLLHLPRATQAVLALEPTLDQWAQRLARSEHLFCIGRHYNYPIALQGALKMQEVAYVYAEGHPGGELKHGPLALVDARLPVIACLPWNRLAEKLLANLQEVRARHGELFVLSDAGLTQADRLNIARMPADLHDLNPILYVIALQLLAFRIAICKGNEIDTPRYLAKSFATEQ